MSERRPTARDFAHAVLDAVEGRGRRAPPPDSHGPCYDVYVCAAITAAAAARYASADARYAADAAASAAAADRIIEATLAAMEEAVSCSEVTVKEPR